MRKKWGTFILGAILVMGIITGCQQTASSPVSSTNSSNPSVEASSNPSKEAPSNPPVGDNNRLGQVKSISDNTITLVLGTQPERPENPQGDGQEMPAAPPSSGEAAPDGERGGTPRGGMGPRGLTFSGEEIAITITDSTKITIDNHGQAAEGSLSDIAEGDIVTVTLVDNSVSEIIVRQMTDEISGK